MRQDASKRPQEAPRGPKRPQEIPKRCPRRPQDAPKRPLRGPRRPQEAPRTPQDAPKPPHVDSTLESILNPPEVLINWRGGTKAQPSTIRRPSRVGVLDSTGRVLRILPPILLPHSSSRRFLSPPPKSSPSSLGPTPSAAAICGAGASWRLLGRKNRVPRGLQKLIKF